MSGPACNKCRQEAGHLGDSWCLCCSAVEALSGELRANWGGAGTRGVAADILSSAVRQLRALRRLGIAGAGQGQARREVAGGSRATTPRCEVPEPEHPPRAEAAPGTGEGTVGGVKEEDKGDPGDLESQEEEEEESDEEEAEPRAPAAAPKRKAENEDRSPVPRRRLQSLPPPPSPPRGESRGERARERSRRRDRSVERRGERRDRRREETEDDDRRHPPEGGAKKKKKKKNKSHRAGSKHQRLYRAETNPYQRLHYKPPGSYWDQGPASL